MELFKIFGRIAVKGAKESEKEIKSVANSAEDGSKKVSAFGGIMKGLGKGVLVATGAAVTGSVALIKSVSSSYGELQQSIGGIETLFKDSAQTVIENANNAFKTAGISANEYMQQATSFSAALLNALDGDTKKACDSADMAIRDMSDNANKMGTSMEMIQNAYQGFSKQNYTMLDNLKLGYGGTKGEMQRLLKDAQKLSGVKYDINNLSDVFEAIHVIQEELGITGTTAKEAGETIEGSFGSLGASWKNFIAGLGDPSADMKQLVDNLAKGIEGAVTNVTPIIENIVKVLPTVMTSIINALGSMLPTLITTFTDLITKVLDAIVALLPSIIPLFVDMVLKVAQALIENLPLIVDAGLQLVLGLVKGISDALPQLLPIIIEVIYKIIDILMENLPLILEVGVQLLMALITGITEALPLLIDKIPLLIETIVQLIVENLPFIIECGLQIIGALTTGIISAIPEILVSIPQIIGAFAKGLLNGIGKLIGIGEDWGDSLLGGFMSKLKNIKLPHIKIKGSLNPLEWFKGKAPSIGVEWYAKGGIMTEPTIFGYNQLTGNAMVGGEAGAEAIAPISTLQSYVSSSVKQEMSVVESTMNKLIDLLGTYLPDIRNAMNQQQIVLDNGALVGGIVNKMDTELGNISSRKARFGV